MQSCLVGEFTSTGLHTYPTRKVIVAILTVALLEFCVIFHFEWCIFGANSTVCDQLHLGVYFQDFRLDCDCRSVLARTLKSLFCRAFTGRWDPVDDGDAYS